MDFQPTPKQALVIWKLLFTGEEPALQALRPTLEARDRAPLVRAGLIELEKRGRSTHVALTGKAWDWAVAHFDARVSRLRTPQTAVVLEAVLTKLKHYMQARDVPLVELMGGLEEEASGADGGLVGRIRAAYLEASGGRLHERVRIARLRELLRGVPRATVDDALLALERSGELSLMTLDNPIERHAEDEEAALRLGAERRHIVYLSR